jgi:hypothetical protein
MMITCLSANSSTGRFGAGSRGEKWPPTFLSVAWHGEAFHWLRAQDVTEFDSDWCSVLGLISEGHEKKRKENAGWRDDFLPCWLCHGSQLLGAIRGWFKVSLCIFFSAPNVIMAVILVGSNQNYPSVGVTKHRIFASVPYPPSLIFLSVDFLYVDIGHIFLLLCISSIYFYCVVVLMNMWSTCIIHLIIF